MSESESPKSKKNPNAVAMGLLGGHAKALKYGSAGMRRMADKRWAIFRVGKKRDNY